MGYTSKFKGAEIDDVIELFSQLLFPKEWADKAFSGQLSGDEIKEICKHLNNTYNTNFCFAKGKLWHVQASAGNGFGFYEIPRIFGEEMYVESYGFAFFNGQVEQYRGQIHYGLNIANYTELDWEHNSPIEG